MADWESCVEFCHKHYNNCYNCPIRGECWEKRKDKNKSRTSKEYETDMILALKEYKNETD